VKNGESACPFSALNDGFNYDPETIAAHHPAHINKKIGSKPKVAPKTKKQTQERTLKKGEEPQEKPGKGYWKFKKWMRKNMGIVPPKDHYVFYVYEGNCKPYTGEYDADGRVHVDAMECGYYSWDGTYIGPSYMLCNPLDDSDGLLQACEGHRTVTGNVTSPDHDPNHPALGHYIKTSNVLDLRLDSSGSFSFRSVVTGGTGAFLGISGELIYDIPRSEPTLIYPQIMIASGPYMKELALYEYSDFDEDNLNMPGLSEWFMNITGML